MKPIHYCAVALGAVIAASCGSDHGSGDDGDASAALPPADPMLAAGEAIYSAECALCHDEGEEGAPEVADAAAWAPREAKGTATLINHAINGFTGEDGEMPARGGTPTLTDAEIESAVKYMLSIPKT